jgi:two-component system, cell cycle sensor histidine kinase and response regulator CckA
MIKRIRESLILKWMVFSILLATIPLIIVGFGIVQIYHEDLRRSLITVEGIALAVGILLSLLLTRKLILPIKRLSKEMEEELVQRTRELEALNEMGTLINQTLVDLDTIFPIALEKAMSLTGFEMGSIFMLNEERNILERKFHKGFPPKMLEDGEVLKYGEGVSGRAVILKQPIINSINEYSSFRVSPVLIEGGIQTLVGFPLLAKGKAIGTITLFSRSPHDFTQREVNLLESIGNQIGLALENAKLFEEVKKRLDELTILYEITKISTSSLNLDLMLREIINSLNSFFKFEALGILLIEENTKILVLHRASYNDLSISDIGKLGLCVGKGITGWVAEKGEPLLVDDVREDDRYICGDENIRSEMCVPLKVGQKVIGVIDAQSKELNAFSENNLRLLNIATGQIATIIENVRLYEEIKQSEEKYRTVVEGVHDGVAVLGTDFKFKYVNNRLSEILGYSKEELTGMDFQNVLTEENQQFVIDRYVKWVRKEENTPHFEFDFLRKDGEIRHMEIRNKEMRDSEGNMSFVALMRDISERKLAEEALRQSEEKYRTILENIEDGYYEADIAGNFTFFNDSMCQIFGYPKEELMGMNNRQYTDKENAKRLFQAFNKVYRTGEPGRGFAYEIIRKDGTKRYIEASISLQKDSSGKPIGFRGVIRDITERKQAEEALRQSEEKYRAILENIEDGYYEVDLAGNMTFFNDSINRISGYSKEEAMGMNIRKYTDEETAKKVIQAYNRVYRTGEPYRGYSYEIIAKDETKRYIEVSVSLQKDSSGKPIGFRGILRDITEKKRMEEQLLQSEKLRAVGEMASGVAHDFNNALAAILGNTQLLLYTTKDEELKGSLKVIEKVAWDSAQTVRRLQDFTRKSVHQELFKVDVNSIIKDSIEITKPKWKDEVQSRGIHIEMVSNFEEIPTVIGSTSELREVITNMIFNAIEAMPEGGKIEIRTFQRKSNVFIQISDSGIGMTEEVKKKAFEPFFTTKPFSNTGLGLSMSYGVIKRFGGEIEVESKVGHGATFTIILPIGLEGKEEVDVSPIIKKGREARILVIDDEETVRSVLSRILSQVNHQVTVAENGEEGIRLFREKDFDLVLTDLGMPGMSGWEVCRAIKKMSSHIPVGMITGWGIEVDQAKIEENGIDFVIPKPFQFDQILKVVDETIASRGSHL